MYHCERCCPSPESSFSGGGFLLSAQHTHILTYVHTHKLEVLGKKYIAHCLFFASGKSRGKKINYILPTIQSERLNLGTYVACFPTQKNRNSTLFISLPIHLFIYLSTSYLCWEVRVSISRFRYCLCSSHSGGHSGKCNAMVTQRWAFNNFTTTKKRYRSISCRVVFLTLSLYIYLYY